MSSLISQNGRDLLRRVKPLSRGLACCMLAALPLGGLLFFLEITKPARLYSDGAEAELSSTIAGSGAVASLAGRRDSVTRLQGVSAELHPDAVPEAPYTQVFNASEARQALACAPYASLKAGFQTEFVTSKHRRVALRIISRSVIVDRAVPDNARLMDVVPASTANVVSFVWGPWLYTAEVQDKGPEPEVVVQKIL